MKHLKKALEVRTKFIFQREGGPDGNENLGPRVQATPQDQLQNQTLRLGTAGMQLDARHFGGPEAGDIRAMTGELRDNLYGVSDGLTDLRLQGSAALSGINAENLAETARLMGASGQSDVVDSIAAATRNFANNNETGTGADLFDMLANLLKDLGIEVPEEGLAAAQKSVNNLGASSGAYDIPAPENIENPPGTVGWERAHQELIQGGVMTLSSSGMGTSEDGRSRASNRSCIDGFRESTISGAKALQTAVGGETLVCTGGTEEGHANGPMSHSAGYKIDYRPTPSLENLTGLTAMGQRKTMDIGGQRVDFYRHAPDHFDVKFYPA